MKKLTEKDLPELNKIQDELGIDLTTLWELCSNGGYVKYNGEKIYTNDFSYRFGTRTITIRFKYHNQNKVAYSYTNQYGKDFALTKEELI